MRETKLKIFHEIFKKNQTEKKEKRDFQPSKKTRFPTPISMEKTTNEKKKKLLNQGKISTS